MSHSHIKESCSACVNKQLVEQLWCDRDLGLIEYFEGPTSSVSPIVVAPKPKSPDKNRVGVGMGQQNCPMMEMIGELNSALFHRDGPRLRVKSAQPRRSLDIITFSIHISLMRCKRLNLGITSTA